MKTQVVMPTPGIFQNKDLYSESNGDVSKICVMSLGQDAGKKKIIYIYIYIYIYINIKT